MSIFRKKPSLKDDDKDCYEKMLREACNKLDTEQLTEFEQFDVQGTLNQKLTSEKEKLDSERRIAAKNLSDISRFFANPIAETFRVSRDKENDMMMNASFFIADKEIMRIRTDHFREFDANQTFALLELYEEMDWKSDGINQQKLLKSQNGRFYLTLKRELSALRNWTTNETIQIMLLNETLNRGIWEYIGFDINNEKTANFLRKFNNDDMSRWNYTHIISYEASNGLTTEELLNYLLQIGLISMTKGSDIRSTFAAFTKKYGKGYNHVNPKCFMSVEISKIETDDKTLAPEELIIPIPRKWNDSLFIDETSSDIESSIEKLAQKSPAQEEDESWGIIP